MLVLLEEASEPLAVMGMGALGRASRLLFAKAGSAAQLRLVGQTPGGRSVERKGISRVAGSRMTASCFGDRVLVRARARRVADVLALWRDRSHCVSLETCLQLSLTGCVWAVISPGMMFAVACDHLFDEELALSVRADFLRALHSKGETPAEIAAFVDVLLARGVRLELGKGLLDVCGTGGDRAGLFNISTAVMFVAAACGARVVKHGNRGITSKCGGADVLEALGIRIDLPPEAALHAAGCCFLFAPLYHPTFKAVAPVRKALAEEESATIFNLLGPLLNPARPDFQLAGVFDRKLLVDLCGNIWPARPQARVGRSRKRRPGRGLHLGPSEVHALEPGGIRRFSIRPETLGFAPAVIEELRGSDARRNAESA